MQDLRAADGLPERLQSVHAEAARRRLSLYQMSCDFAEKSALYLPKEAQYEYLVNLPDIISAAQLTGISGHPLFCGIYGRSAQHLHFYAENTDPGTCIFHINMIK